MEGKRTAKLNPKIRKLFFRITHVAFGFLTAFIFTRIPLAGLALVTCFLAYEVVEKWAIKDSGYPEIAEFTSGLTIGLLIFTTIV